MRRVIDLRRIMSPFILENSTSQRKVAEKRQIALNSPLASKFFVSYFSGFCASDIVIV